MAQPPPETIVMKFGGSSVADPDKVKLVARRFVDAKRPVRREQRRTARTEQLIDSVIGVARRNDTELNAPGGGARQHAGAGPGSEPGTDDDEVVDRFHRQPVAQ